MGWVVHTGDCRDVLSTLAESSVDTVICDPPYGLSFMGKGWDHAVPGADYWRAVLRVAKPGAMLLAFGGTRTFHRLAAAIEDAGWEVRDCMSWLYGSGFPKSLNIEKAGGGEKWHGWGTALKPAWEPIILAMKPLDGTFAENAQRHGVAGLAIDAGRIDGGARPARVKLTGTPNTDGTHCYGEALSPGSRARGVPDTTAGRWPANVLLDEVAAAALDEQSGDLPGAGNVGGTPRSELGYEGGGSATAMPATRDNGGGASRFFYVAKAARGERGVGNDHPTVKPIDLMRYLARLTRTPAGGVVLDPFAGSGSTGIGALLEGRDFIGIELSPDYAELARKRIAAADPVGTQGNLFSGAGRGP